MLKILGAMLIICGTGAWGIGSAMRMRNRVSSLKALVESMEMLKDEICVNLTPLGDVMNILGRCASKPISVFYENVSAGLTKIADIGFFGVWMEALDKSESIILGEAERDVLIRLGAGLGKYDAESQGRVIANAKRNLEKIEAKAETEKETNSRLHAFLGVAAGMMAVVVLF